MKAKVLIVSLSLVVLAACSKDKYDTKPTLTFEDLNAKEFVQNQILTIKLKLTDKEGDFTSGDTYLEQPLYYQQVSLICPSDPGDTIPKFYDIPRFNSRKYLNADLDINFIYNSFSGPYLPIDRAECATTLQKSDSVYFKFWIKDEAGNTSDTIKTPTFTLLKD